MMEQMVHKCEQNLGRIKMDTKFQPLSKNQKCSRNLVLNAGRCISTLVIVFLRAGRYARHPVSKNIMWSWRFWPGCQEQWLGRFPKGMIELMVCRRGSHPYLQGVYDFSCWILEMGCRLSVNVDALPNNSPHHWLSILIHTCSIHQHLLLDMAPRFGDSV